MTAARGTASGASAGEWSSCAQILEAQRQGSSPTDAACSSLLRGRVGRMSEGGGECGFGAGYIPRRRWAANSREERGRRMLRGLRVDPIRWSSGFRWAAEPPFLG